LWPQIYLFLNHDTTVESEFDGNFLLKVWEVSDGRNQFLIELN
jgi:hypothetical protein